MAALLAASRRAPPRRCYRTRVRGGGRDRGGISSRPPSVRSVTSRYRYVRLRCGVLAGGANDEIASATATADDDGRDERATKNVTDHGVLPVVRVGRSARSTPRSRATMFRWMSDVPEYTSPPDRASELELDPGRLRVALRTVDLDGIDGRLDRRLGGLEPCQCRGHGDGGPLVVQRRCLVHEQAGGFMAELHLCDAV